MSVYSAEIPYSFYNFEVNRNTLLQYVVTNYADAENTNTNTLVWCHVSAGDEFLKESPRRRCAVECISSTTV